MVTYAQGEFHLKKVRFLMLIIITFCLVINMTACSKEKTDNYNDANILGRWVETYGDQELIFLKTELIQKVLAVIIKMGLIQFLPLFCD